MRFPRKRLTVIAAALLLCSSFLGTAAYAQNDEAAVGQTVVITAPVLSVNKDTREITLQIDGLPHVIKADDRVKNFDQIKTGDVLRVGYAQALSITPAPDATGRSTTTSQTPPTATGGPGEKPGVFSARTTTMISRIEALNPAKQTVTLEGPQGNYITVQSQNPEDFQKLKVGQYIETTYNEAVIIEITKP